MPALANAAALVASVVADARKAVPAAIAAWSNPVPLAWQKSADAQAEAEANCADWVHPLTGQIIRGSTPNKTDWTAIERERELPPGLSRRQVGPPRIW